MMKVLEDTHQLIEQLRKKPWRTVSVLLVVALGTVLFFYLKAFVESAGGEHGRSSSPFRRVELGADSLGADLCAVAEESSPGPPMAAMVTESEAEIDQLRNQLVKEPRLAPKLHADIGVIYKRLGNLGKAAEHLQTSVSAWKGIANRANLAAVLCELRDTGRALPLFAEAEKAAQVERDETRYATTVLMRADCLRELGQLSKAFDALATIELAAGTASGYLAIRGELHRLSGNHAEAVQDLQTAIETGFPVWQQDKVLLNLGISLSEVGRYEQAAAILEEGLELNPCSAALLNSLGNVARKTGNYGGAHRCFEASVVCDPGYVPAYHSMVILGCDQKDCGMALGRLNDYSSLLRSRVPERDYNYLELLATEPEAAFCRAMCRGFEPTKMFQTPSNQPVPADVHSPVPGSRHR